MVIHSFACLYVPLKSGGSVGARISQPLKVAPSERLERPTPSLGRRCSIHLNYEGLSSKSNTADCSCELLGTISVESGAFTAFPVDK